MPHFLEEKIVKIDREFLFSLVADVKSYPEFVPGCKRAQITPVSDTEMYARLSVAMGPVSESYTSHVVMTPYERIEAKSSNGPFSSLRNLWTFKDVEGGVLVRCEIDCEFKSFLVSKFAGPFFKESSRMMLKAFLDRASSLQGSLKK